MDQIDLEKWVGFSKSEVKKQERSFIHTHTHTHIHGLPWWLNW